MSLICGSCGTPAAAGQRFCGQCGAALPTTASAGPEAPVAERRLVSVLFADLVGFTPFAEGRDAEDVRDALSRYFELATRIVTRQGGVIEKFIGDAVMAVWGTPTAREDDAERAVRAAIELVAEVPSVAPGIQARCGVLTGEAVVTLGASNQGMVAGDIVNTAARLQSAAAPSTVLVGEATFRAASRAIEFAPAGDHELKGKSAPVPTWRAVAVLAERADRSGVEGVVAPFVGSGPELRLLTEILGATIRDGRASHVTLLGVPGVGKSRLAWELERHAAGLAAPILWYAGRAPAYGQGITFWPLGEIVRALAGLAEADDDAASRLAIAKLLDEHVASDTDRPRVEASLLQLLGVPGSLPPEELFGAWRTFFERLSRTGTVVLVVEDAHWADAGTLDFIDHLMTWARDATILVLSIGRPELLEARPSWAEPRPGHTTIVVEPLPETDVRSLLGGLAPRIPDRVVGRIAARSEGLPLYAVEMLRMLVTRGSLRLGADGTLEPAGDPSALTEVAVPETLTSLISARLDGLPAAERALALDAAVLGQSFQPSGLAAITGRTVDELDPVLQSLTRREVLTQVVDRRSPERGQYVFVQALVRETAYRTLAKRDRRRRHLAVARWLESLADPELAAALAGHLLDALRLTEPGPERDALSAQTRHALRDAGDRAAGLSAPRQAWTFYEQAAELSEESSEQAALLELAGSHAIMSAEFDAGDVLFVREIELLRRLGDRERLARSIGERARGLLAGHRYGQGLALLDAARLEFADVVGTSAYLLLMEQQARAVFLRGDSVRAIELAAPVVAAAEELDEPAILASALITLGSALTTVGRQEEGRAMLARAGGLAEAHGLAQLHMRAANNTFISLIDEDPAAAFAAGSEALVVATRLGHRNQVHSIDGSLGWLDMLLGRWDDGVRRTTGVLADTDDPLDRNQALNSRTALRLLRGQRVDEDMAELKRTAATMSATDAPIFLEDTLGYEAFADGRLEDAAARWWKMVDDHSVAGLVAQVAHVELWRGDADAAERALEGRLGILPDTGPAGAMRLALRAGVAGLRGRRDEALAAYAKALPAIREAGLRFEEVLVAIDMAYTLGSNEPLAAGAIARARSLAESFGSPPLLRHIDTAVTNGPYAGAMPVG